MLSAIHWDRVRWKFFSWCFVPMFVVAAMAMFIVALAQELTPLLIPLLMLGVFAQAVALLIVTRSIPDLTPNHFTDAVEENEEEECDESELTFSPVFHANPLPTSITTLDEGRYVGVNDAWTRLFGYTSQEAIGNTSLGLNIWVHPAERSELTRQLQATGSMRDFEHLARTKSGDLRHVLVSAEVIEFNGTRYNLALVHDITERKRTEVKTQRQNAYLEALHQVSLGIIGELNVNELLSTIVERVVQLIDATYGWVYLITPEQDALELCVATGEYQRHAGSRLKRGEGLAGHIWQTGAALAIDDYQTWSGRTSQYDTIPIRAAMGMPIQSGGQVIGVIGLSRTTTNTPFDQDEQDLATRFGHLASIALTNARLHTSLQAELVERNRADQALEERLAFERLITNISTEFINLESDQIDSGIEQALAAIGRFTGSDRSYVFLFSADGKLMDNTHEWCRAGIESHQHLFRNQPIEVLPWAIPLIQQGQVVHIPSFRTLPPQAEAERALTQSHAQPTLSVIAVPVAFRGQVSGLLGFDSVRAENTWSEDSIALLRVVGEIFLNALERKRAAEALRKSELRFRTMFENASIGMAITEIGDNTIQSNPALSKMLGYSLEELTHLGTLDYTYPEDLPAQQALENEILIGERDHYQIEKRYIRKDGQLVWGRMIRSVARDATGKMLYRLGMVEDITAQKLAAQKLEEAYRTLEQRVEERTHELATLNAIAASVSRSLDLKEIMRDALQKMMELTGMEHGIAYRVGGEEDSTSDAPNAYLRVMAFRGFPPDYANLGDGLSLPDSAAGVAARHGEPMIWSLAELPSQNALKQRLASQGVQQVIAIPLMAKGRFVGSLNLSTNRIQVYPSEQIALLKTIGQQVGVAIENARLYEQAERSAQVAERSRLARELHDSVTQSLYSMTLYAEATARLLNAGNYQEAASNLRDLRDTSQEALREMRLLIFELRPPALESGLAVALQTRLDSVESRGGIHAELRVEGQEHLSHALQAELYNIALEALNNALKHAQAHRIQVQLCFDAPQVTMNITDDGVGFEPTTARLGGGFGISGMQERAQRIGAKLEITSQPGNGTRIAIQVPLNIQEMEDKPA